MLINNQRCYLLLTGFAVSTILLSACSKQNWYSGAQSSLSSYCMQQPHAEYNDCMQQSADSYNEYEKKRQKLIEENTVN